jgi:hypothetical protein
MNLSLPASKARTTGVSSSAMSALTRPVHSTLSSTNLLTPHMAAIAESGTRLSPQHSSRGEVIIRRKRRIWSGRRIGAGLKIVFEPQRANGQDVVARF